MLGRRRRCLGLCIAAVGLTLLLGHKLTCVFSVSLCTPLPLTAIRLLRGFASLNGRPGQVDPARFAASNELDCQRYAALPKRRAQWVVVLSTALSGSTFFIRSLVQAQVVQHDEVLLQFSRDCHGRIDTTGCTFDELVGILASKLQATQGEHSHSVVKIQYNHIPPAFLDRFAAFCACNRVAVVHLIRESVLEMFWTNQAQVLDAVQNGYLKDRIHSKHERDGLHSNQGALSLPVPEALAFVRAIESWREGYRLLLHLHPHRILYTEVFYEDLTGPYGQRHFNAVQQVLGMTLTQLTSTRLVRVHPGRCSAKIANWGAVEAALRREGLFRALRACLLPAQEIRPSTW